MAALIAFQHRTGEIVAVDFNDRGYLPNGFIEGIFQDRGGNHLDFWDSPEIRWEYEIRKSRLKCRGEQR